MGKVMINPDNVIQEIHIEQGTAPSPSFIYQWGLEVSVAVGAGVLLWILRRFYRKVLSRYSFKVVKKDD